MWIFKLLRVLYENQKDVRDERDGIYTMLGLVTAVERKDGIRIDLVVRYAGTEVRRASNAELLVFDGFVPKNKSLAQFSFYEKRTGQFASTARIIIVPLSSITSMEMSGFCVTLKGEPSEAKVPAGGVFSKN